MEESHTPEALPWATYHGRLNKCENPITSMALLPLSKEKAASAGMMMHTLKVAGEAIEFLNPGKVPILVADQPLYAILKQIQYLSPGV